jgi:creatine kinase
VAKGPAPEAGAVGADVPATDGDATASTGVAAGGDSDYSEGRAAQAARPVRKRKGKPTKGAPAGAAAAPAEEERKTVALDPADLEKLQAAAAAEKEKDASDGSGDSADGEASANGSGGRAATTVEAEEAEEGGGDAAAADSGDDTERRAPRKMKKKKKKKPATAADTAGGEGGGGSGDEKGAPATAEATATGAGATGGDAAEPAADPSDPDWAVWSAHDQDRSGTVSTEELGGLFSSAGLELSAAQLAALLASADHDGSGRLSFKEFKALLQRCRADGVTNVVNGAVDAAAASSTTPPDAAAAAAAAADDDDDDDDESSSSSPSPKKDEKKKKKKKKSVKPVPPADEVGGEGSAAATAAEEGRKMVALDPADLEKLQAAAAAEKEKDASDGSGDSADGEASGNGGAKTAGDVDAKAGEGEGSEDAKPKKKKKRKKKAEAAGDTAEADGGADGAPALDGAPAAAASTAGEERKTVALDPADLDKLQAAVAAAAAEGDEAEDEKKVAVAGDTAVVAASGAAAAGKAKGVEGGTEAAAEADAEADVGDDAPPKHQKKKKKKKKPSTVANPDDGEEAKDAGDAEAVAGGAEGGEEDEAVAGGAEGGEEDEAVAGGAEGGEEDAKKKKKRKKKDNAPADFMDDALEGDYVKPTAAATTEGGAAAKPSRKERAAILAKERAEAQARYEKDSDWPAWERFDADKSGFVTVAELGSMFETAGLVITAEQLTRVVLKADENKSGTLQFPEFKALLTKCRDDGVEAVLQGEEKQGDAKKEEGSGVAEAGDARKDEVAEEPDHKDPDWLAWLSFDEDGSGSISVAELGELFASAGIDSATAAVEEYVALADMDSSGTLSFAEFKKLLRGIRAAGGMEQWLTAEKAKKGVAGDGEEKGEGGVAKKKKKKKLPIDASDAPEGQDAKPSPVKQKPLRKKGEGAAASEDAAGKAKSQDSSHHHHGKDGHHSKHGHHRKSSHKEGFSMTEEAMKAKDGNRELPEGWMRVASHSRKGEISYKCLRTGLRQKHFPDATHGAAARSSSSSSSSSSRSSSGGSSSHRSHRGAESEAAPADGADRGPRKVRKKSLGASAASPVGSPVAAASPIGGQRPARKKSGVVSTPPAAAAAAATSPGAPVLALTSATGAHRPPRKRSVRQPTAEEKAEEDAKAAAAAAAAKATADEAAAKAAANSLELAPELAEKVMTTRRRKKSFMAPAAASTSSSPAEEQDAKAAAAATAAKAAADEAAAPVEVEASEAERQRADLISFLTDTDGTPDGAALAEAAEKAGPEAAAAVLTPEQQAAAAAARAEAAKIAAAEAAELEREKRLGSKSMRGTLYAQEARTDAEGQLSGGESGNYWFETLRPQRRLAYFASEADADAARALREQRAIEAKARKNGFHSNSPLLGNRGGAAAGAEAPLGGGDGSELEVGSIDLDSMTLLDAADSLMGSGAVAGPVSPEPLSPLPGEGESLGCDEGDKLPNATNPGAAAPVLGFELFSVDSMWMLSADSVEAKEKWVAAIDYCQTTQQASSTASSKARGAADSPLSAEVDTAAAAVAAAAAPSAAPRDQELWAEHIDPSSGQHFFYSRKTRKCTFERPAGPNVVIKTAGSSNNAMSDLSQLGTAAFAYARDPKTTAEHEYYVYERCPAFTPQHRSLLSRLLTRELWDNVQGKMTKKGFSLSNVVQPGVESIALPIGVVAGDEFCYSTFSELLNPIVSAWHAFDPLHQTHKHDLDTSKVALSAADAALIQRHARSCRCRAVRNISGFSLPAGTGAQDRLGVEETLRRAVATLDNDLRGRYVTLGGISKEDDEFLREHDFKFLKPEPSSLTCKAGGAREWPDNRGVFHNDSNTALLWVNEEDHCRVMTTQDGADLRAVFGRFVRIHDALSAALSAGGHEFMVHPRLGYLTSCPSNLGSAFRASMDLRLPQLGKCSDLLQSTCSAMGLHAMPAADQGEAAKEEEGSVGGAVHAACTFWEISNRKRLGDGASEVESVNLVLAGAAKVIAMEHDLQAQADVLVQEEQDRKAALLRQEMDETRRQEVDELRAAMEMDLAAQKAEFERVMRESLREKEEEHAKKLADALQEKNAARRLTVDLLDAVKQDGGSVNDLIAQFSKRRPSLEKVCVRAQFAVTAAALPPLPPPPLPLLPPPPLSLPLHI